MDFLQHTINELSDNNRTFDDVIWIGSADGTFQLSVKEFKQLAYIDICESWCDEQEIMDDLVIVGDGWWLERYVEWHETRMFEGWVYKEPSAPPLKAKNNLPITSLRPTDFNTKPRHITGFHSLIENK